MNDDVDMPIVEGSFENKTSITFNSLRELHYQSRK